MPGRILVQMVQMVVRSSWEIYPFEEIYRKCCIDNIFCLLCSVAVCRPAFVQAQSSCTVNTVALGQGKKTEADSSTEKSWEKYNICHDFIAVNVYKDTNENCADIFMWPYHYLTTEVDFKICDKQSKFCRLRADPSLYKSTNIQNTDSAKLLHYL